MIQITFKTKQGATHSFQATNFNYNISNYEKAEISLSIAMEQPTDPFVLRLLSQAISSKKEKSTSSFNSLKPDSDEASGLEVTIAFDRMKGAQIEHCTIQLRNSRINTSLSESVSAYSPAVIQFNSSFSLSSNDATIYGVDLPEKGLT